MLVMLTNSSKYALKAVLYLSLHTDETKKIQVKEISDNIEIPRAYTAKLLQALSKRGIISSARGPKGGFFVDEKNKRQSLMSVIEVIDGKQKLENCMLGLSDCDEEKPCPLHFYISHSRAQLLHTLENKTIEELAIDLKDKKSFLPL